MTAALTTPVGLVVPVFNEATRVREFCRPLLEFLGGLPQGSELVFVDDGSSDGTADLLADLLADAPASARVLRRPHLGKGAAVAAGLAHLSTPVRAFCDLDLSTPLSDLRKIIAAGGHADVLAIGSRDLVGSVMLRPESRLREALGRTYNRLLQATVAPGVVDTQCGAKAATAGVWTALLDRCHEPGFAWDAEIVAVALALGIEVHELPVAWRHDDRSRVRVLRDGTRMVLATGRIVRSRNAARRSVRSTADAGRGEVFDDANAERLLAVDRTHWWFRSKAALVATAIHRTGGATSGQGWLLDAGAGAGGVTAMLGWRPEQVVLLEGNDVLAARAVGRFGFAGACSSVDPMPLRDGSVEVVCLLDVIEHLEDPVSALAEARRCLAPGGRVVVNVPAHPWLWSTADVELGHHRRYTRPLLRRHLAEAGFLEPVLLTHVFSWLVPPVWLLRRLVRPGSAELGLEQTSPLVDRASMVLTGLERQLVGRCSIPVGTSVLAVARAPGGPAG